MKLNIRHRTTYRYKQPPHRVAQTLRLTPPDSAHQRVLSWQLQASLPMQPHDDTWGNRSHLLVGERPPRRLVIESHGQIETFGCAQTLDPTGPAPMLYRRSSALAMPHPALEQLAMQAELRPRSHLHQPPDLNELLALADMVRTVVVYAPGHTDATTTALQALEAGRGVCQDQAHVYIAVCRSLGWAARYVSGYFHAPQAERLASHAWAEVCLDENTRSWVGIDITHACLIDQRHVRLAVGPDYAACAPVHGVRSGGDGEQLDVSLQICTI